MLRNSLRFILIAASGFAVYFVIYFLPAAASPVLVNSSANYPYPTPISGYPTATATPTVTPTGIPITPEAPATVVVDEGKMVVVLTSVPTPDGGGEVRLAVAVATNQDLGEKASSVLKPLKSLFVSLTTNGVPNHEDLPEPAKITIQYSTTDLPTGADPLKVVLFLVSEEGAWEALPDTQIISLGYPAPSGSYEATASAPHFSFITAGFPPPVYVPISFKSVTSSSW